MGPEPDTQVKGGCKPYCRVSTPARNLIRGDWKRSFSAGRVNKRLTKEHNKKLYHATVESWKPGNNKIVCPNCGYKVQPVVKKMNNKVYRSPLGALCTVGCWPCLLPFAYFGNHIVNIYCSQCNQFLGTYDRKRNVLVEKNTTEIKSTSNVQSGVSEPVFCACKPDCQD
ncbi:hypothetical protein L9F63_019090 [Diploptera punctata]|uniref:LITAF domain-containing protein n=1 Tax=Diploptera punctata TaxID=6984 RepID=A0AAD7ZV03_DIPPU|nr:hypothetical protein L9F63_019090 [Diploptera punctata]